MICRHAPGDRSCTTQFPEPRIEYREVVVTPDAEKYKIRAVERRGKCLILRVEYPNCKKCSYEGFKVLVFEGVTEADALLWTCVDPHFRAPAEKKMLSAAPSPIARFPASDKGWANALKFAQMHI